MHSSLHSTGTPCPSYRRQLTIFMLLCLLALSVGYETPAHASETAVTLDPGNTDGQLGFSVAATDDTMFVGAPAEADNSLPQGAVYAFNRSPETGEWARSAELRYASNLPVRRFGHSLAATDRYVVVGSQIRSCFPCVQGSVIVFDREYHAKSTLWVSNTRLVPAAGEELDDFGASVGVSGDTIVVGAPVGLPVDDPNAPGAAYIFQRNASGSWNQVAKLSGPADGSYTDFGAHVAISGDTVVVGSNTSSVRVFERNAGGPNAWGQVTTLLPPGGYTPFAFGSSLGFSGDLLAIGGGSFIYRRSTAGIWQLEHVITSISDTVASGSVGLYNGTTLIIGAPDVDGKRGAAYVFSRDAGSPGGWGQIATLRHQQATDGDYFGYAVAINGYSAVIGAPFEGTHFAESGAAYRFRVPGNTTPIATAQRSSIVEDTAGIVRLNGQDVDHDVLSYTITALPGHGILYQYNAAANSPGAPIIAGGTVTDRLGRVVFSPAPDGNGSPYSSFSFTASDGIDISAQATFTIDILAVNDTPVIAPVANQTTDEDVPLIGMPVLLSDSDHTANALTLSATSSSQTLLPNTSIKISPGAGPDQRLLSLTPAADASGSATVTLTVIDPGGAKSSRSFALSVAPVNDAPYGISLTNSSIAAGKPGGTRVGILTTQDIDGGPIYSYSLVSGDGDGDNTRFSIVGNDLRTAVALSPDQNQYSVRVESYDGHGGRLQRAFVVTLQAGSVTITSSPPADGSYGKLYGHQFTATGESSLSFSVASGQLPPGLSLSSSGYLSGIPTRAGTFGPITVSAASTSASTSQSFYLTIAKATLIVTAQDQVRKIGTPNPPLTLSYAGFMLTDTTASLDLLPTATTSAATNSPVGSYPITPSGGAAANYTLSYVPGSLSITTQEVPQLVWDTPAPIVYGMGLAAGQLNATASNGGKSVTGSFSYSPAAGTVLGAGTHELRVVFTPADTSVFAQVTRLVTLVVRPAKLQVVANNVTVPSGQPLPALGYTVTDLVNGDTAARALTGAPQTAATVESPPGRYSITQGTLAATNYDISFVEGELLITASEITTPVYIPLLRR